MNYLWYSTFWHPAVRNRAQGSWPNLNQKVVEFDAAYFSAVGCCGRREVRNINVCVTRLVE